MALTQMQKHNFLLVLFFSTSDNPEDDVNPYDSVGIFRKSKVGSLNWGPKSKPKFRTRAKSRFADTYVRTLGVYDIDLTEAQAKAGVRKEDTKIDEIVAKWVEQAAWP